MKIYTNLTQLIGNTPLLHPLHLSELHHLNAQLLLKLECFNPGGSVKDRVALAMIEDAEREGKLLPGGTIIEPTSGNTGIGLAWIAKLKGYRLVLTMPETMSVERQQLLRALGAELELTSGQEGMKGAIARAQVLQSEIPGAIILQQFNNPACVTAHEEHTGKEILRDTDGRIDVFVACVGTGGTLTGTARALKRENPNIKIVAVEPQSSPVLSGGAPGAHKIQGIGAGFIPAIYDATVVDEVVCVGDGEAMAAAKKLAATEGVLVGFSSGAALHAATELVRRGGCEDKNIVVLLPDGGERYLSTDLFG